MVGVNGNEWVGSGMRDDSDEPRRSQVYWRCPNCGQMNFSDEPPDMCDFCQDFTTWQPVSEDEECDDTTAEFRCPGTDERE